MSEDDSGIWWTPDGFSSGPSYESTDFHSKTYGRDGYAEVTIWHHKAEGEQPDCYEVCQWVGDRAINSLWIRSELYPEFCLEHLPHLIEWAERLSLTMLQADREAPSE